MLFRSLEAQLQNVVTNIEIRYWDLYCAYRLLKTAKEGANTALDSWRYIYTQTVAGRLSGVDEAQAREQYLFFRGEVERTWTNLLDAEANLRWLMGIAQTDGNLIRPTDEPTKAWVQFDWNQAVDEALVYRPEVRQEKWEVKKRELQVAYAKNSLLPSFNATALYR